MGRPIKGRNYCGILQDGPGGVEVPGTVSAEWIDAARLLGIGDDEFKAAHRRLLDKSEADSRRRLDALADHFKIHRTVPGWEFDLCLELARKHHPECLKSGLPRLSMVFDTYGIAPVVEGSIFRLIAAISARHVPAFRGRGTRRQPRHEADHIELDDRECWVLLIADLKLARAIKHARERRKLLLDQRQQAKLFKVLGKPLGAEVQKVLGVVGQRQRPSDTRLRNYLTKAKGAREAFVRGESTRDQDQVVRVLDLIHGTLNSVVAGQEPT